ncbi:carbohydrate-binding family 9-like protein [Francisella salina]|uniref:Carbohydrate-binding domain-containing protein n=1 Tax=Francisella salina TaxID=573569 RepID=A0ABM5M8Z9_FRAST|nr:carbohydrate-binding family 9-like protein [Francisella salina]AEI35704.1 hypothetical protein F7308_0777 [Francisella salina]
MTKNNDITLKSNSNSNICNHFYNTLDGRIERDYPTIVNLQASDKYLHIQFECLNNLYTDYNRYTDNNSEMWRQEVFEVFVAAGSDTPREYFKFEVNPNGAIFCAKILNSDKKGTSLKANFIDAQQQLIHHKVSTENKSYSGSISIPFMLIGNSKDFRINFYRIVAIQEPQDKNWPNNELNSKYLAYNPTMSGDSAQFHLPEQMINLNIID